VATPIVTATTSPHQGRLDDTQLADCVQQTKWGLNCISTEQERSLGLVEMSDSLSGTLSQGVAPLIQTALSSLARNGLFEIVFPSSV
jgi:tellurite resistance protein